MGFYCDVCHSDAAVLETDLRPEDLDAWLPAREAANGRDRRAQRFGDRTLDIDLVLYDERIVEGPGHLRVPRGELRHAFVLRPLAEIVPDMLEPRSGRRLAELWAESPERDVAMEAVPGFDLGQRNPSHTTRRASSRERGGQYV